MALPGNTTYTPPTSPKAVDLSKFSGVRNAVKSAAPAPSGTVASLPDDQLENVVSAMARREGYGANPHNRPTRNNNPLNMKYGGATKKWVDQGLATVEATPAADGGHFLVFKDPKVGMQAAKELFRSGIYANLDLNSALKKWSGGGYGSEIVGGSPAPAVQFQPPQRQLASAQAPAPAPKYPVQGFNVTTQPGASTRGEERHMGIDLAGPEGSPIKAFQPGVVTQVQNGQVQGSPGLGNFINIKDVFGNEHRYSHMMGSWVRPGQVVSQGQDLGPQGNSGQTYSDSGGTGSHVDFRVKDVYGNYVNPYNFITVQNQPDQSTS